jgi:TonB family protein
MKTYHSTICILAAALSQFALSPLSAADQRPKAISQSAPAYAFDLRKAEVEGAVLVSYTVTSRGDVVDAAVVSSTNRVFDEPTLNAIKKWKFNPAMQDGHAVGIAVRQLVTFTMSSRNPETPTAALAAKLKLRPSVRNIASNK